MKKKCIVFFLVVMSAMGMAQTNKANSAPTITKDELEAKAVMNQVYDSFVKIMPYIYSEQTFLETRDKKSIDELIGNLSDLQKAFKSANHVNLLKMPGFKPSLETINDHIDRTIDSLNFSTKNRVFAHARLKAMTALCVSCHSGLSDKVSQNAFGDALANVKRDKFDSSFNYANYLFLVRRFTEAKSNYEMALRESIQKSNNDRKMISDDRVLNKEIYASLRRVLTIYTKISIKPDQAIDFLNRYKNNKNLHATTREDIKHWIAELEKWKKFDINSVKDINAFIAKYLSPIVDKKSTLASGEQDVTLLISSGVLTKYLNDNPKSELTPNILYWLAIAERRLSTTYFFSLADLYLKECVIQYPSAPIAKQCYQEYEENVIFGYSGSSGTDIPDEERKELLKLKAYLK